MSAEYTLEQGIRSPRDNTVNWVPYDNFASAEAAKIEARKFSGLWRIVECRVIWEKVSHVNKED